MSPPWPRCICRSRICASHPSSPRARMLHPRMPRLHHPNRLRSRHQCRPGGLVKPAPPSPRPSRCARQSLHRRCRRRACGRRRWGSVSIPQVHPQARRQTPGRITPRAVARQGRGILARASDSHEWRHGARSASLGVMRRTITYQPIAWTWGSGLVDIACMKYIQ